MLRPCAGVLAGVLFAAAMFAPLEVAGEVVETIGEGGGTISAPGSIDGPVRTFRKVAITGELPWNGLGGLGPQVSWYVLPNAAIDIGVGLGGTGFKTGIRGRMLFGEKAAVPFVGFGFATGGGSGGQPVTLTTPENELQYELKRTNFLQFVGGYDIITRGGFTFMGAAGYALCLNRDNVVITQGVPTDSDEQALDIVHRGGLVLSVNLGYAIATR